MPPLSTTSPRRLHPHPIARRFRAFNLRPYGRAVFAPNFYNKVCIYAHALFTLNYYIKNLSRLGAVFKSFFNIFFVGLFRCVSRNRGRAKDVI